MKIKRVSLKKLLDFFIITVMSPIYSFHEYKKLFNLARTRTRSSQDYIDFEQYQCELIVKYLYSRGISLNEKLIVDLGCGLGGYTKKFNSLGADPIGLDLNVSYLPSTLKRVTANALTTPFKENKFDFIFCASLIEHVPNPRILISEILRITKPEGFVYISYPPFYSPNGGHQFAPFHLFGERFAIWYFSRFKQISNSDWRDNIISNNPNSFDNAFVSWGLYRLTVKKIVGLLKEFPVKVIDYSTKYSPINFSKIPIINEILTWHVQFLFQKL